MKKKIAFIISVVITTLLTACATENTSSTATVQDRNSAVSSKEAVSLTENSAKETVKLTMPIADKFYAIYNRCSLPVDSSVSVTDANGFAYSPVESVYSTLDALKADTEKYFTKEYLERSFYLNLSDETAFYKDIDGKLYTIIFSFSYLVISNASKYSFCLSVRLPTTFSLISNAALLANTRLSSKELLARRFLP